jgi:hypothetical protein
LYPTTSVTSVGAVQFKTVDDDVVAEACRFVGAVRLVVTVTASVAADKFHYFQLLLLCSQC